MTRLLLGDCREVLATLPADSLDCVVTDPPYDLTSGSTTGGGFMSQKWDSTGVAFEKCTWEAVKRVMKPGAFCLAMGGTRTVHRMTCAMEDAGLEIRDQIAWMHSQGFPKSLNISVALDRAAGATREVIGNRWGNRDSPKMFGVVNDDGWQPGGSMMQDTRIAAIRHKHAMRPVWHASASDEQALLERVDELTTENGALRQTIRNGDHCACCAENDCDCLFGVTWGPDLP